MRHQTSTARYRVAIVALASTALVAGVAGVGIIAADAAPHSAPAAAPALIPCPVPIPIPGLCDEPSPSATASPTSTPSATSTPTTTSTATTTPTVSSTLSVTPTVTATTTTKPSPTQTSTPGTGAHKPLASFSHEAATSKHPTRVVITITARGSLIKKLTKVHLTACTWSLGSPKAKTFKKGRSQIRIVVNRKKESTVGHVSFHAISKAGNDRSVSARV